MDNIIIYEDDTLIIAHKPAGLATQTQKIGEPDLVSKLRNYRKKKGEDTYIGVVHRLDQPVDGLLVFAKTKAAAAALTTQLNKGLLKKSYTAFVDGAVPVGETKSLIDYLLKNPKDNTSKAVPKGTKDAKEARLTYKCIEVKTADNGEPYSKLEIEIFTGRHHQIRVQMSNAGYPLLGDNKYATIHSAELSNRLDIRATALYADKITLIHPRNNKKLNFQLNYEN
jgi:23S rRNA pseudouridine1911/1915/1917 synthase